MRPRRSRRRRSARHEPLSLLLRASIYRPCLWKASAVLRPSRGRSNDTYWTARKARSRGVGPRAARASVTNAMGISVDRITDTAVDAGLVAATELAWSGGWMLVLAGMVSGAVLGLFFHRASFLGGYDSWARRLLRLGHIACIALGFLNLLASLASWRDPSLAWPASVALVGGGVAMPLTCWAAAFARPARHLFFLPVASLVTGVTLVLLGTTS